MDGNHRCMDVQMDGEDGFTDRSYGVSVLMNFMDVCQHGMVFTQQGMHLLVKQFTYNVAS